MSTALDLLSIGDCDDILTVDLESRAITIPNTVENLGVESDDSVRVLHFQVPRYYCEIDLSRFSIRINYKNTSGSGGSYDVAAFSIEDGLIEFDWVVSRVVTIKRGDVVFNVCFREMENEEVMREFNTAVATLPVLEGLETGEELMLEHIDVFEKMRDDVLSEVEDITIATIDRVAGPIVEQIAANEIAGIENRMTGYVNDAQTAKLDAEKAKTSAEQAATNAANNVTNTLSGYVNDANAAKTAAEQAKTDAQTAKNVAEQAATNAANNVQSTLSGYVNDANVAKTAAEKAKTDATTAKNAAEQAKTDAQTAKSAAEQANADAQTAKAAAEQAATIVASVVIPPATSENNGMFLRAVDGVWAAVALTDVSEVGA